VTETCWLLILTAFFGIAWLPGSMAKRRAYGWGWMLSNRDDKTLPPLPLWGERANRAYENLKNYFPVFAVPVLILIQRGESDTAIRWACAGYVLCRLAHFAMYSAGSVVGRATAWVISMALNGYLIVRAF